MLLYPIEWIAPRNSSMGGCLAVEGFGESAEDEVEWVWVAEGGVHFGDYGGVFRLIRGRIGGR